ncbi:MAG: class I SAM-dependent methyltransferase [Chloroflexi bacterium]|nr:class I SAM-dependent methyltransferase [Chloroflexota bacterium]MDA1241112.1 class I SAM-dependent methyltransferase [Chloroflexota bacterium]
MVLLERVQEQYEVLPYPHRDPARELEMLRQPMLSELPRVNSLLWGGRRRLGAGFRVLDAGCGTGDSTVFLGEQLRDSGAEIVAIDFSTTSIEIARQRLDARGIAGVRFVHAAIEDAPELGLGEFDFIVCSGVLHHLASPDAGLRALRSMLKADGGLALMVYATYGRAPVYLMQSLMQRLAPAELGPERRLKVLRTALAGLPSHSRTRRGLLEHETFGPEISQSDAGAYDLLLHTQDRSYTVPELHDWSTQAGMRVLDWAVPRAYAPQTYLPGFKLPVDAGDPAAVAELMHGGMTKHECYLERDDAPPRDRVDPSDPDAVPAWCAWGFGEQVKVALARPGTEFKCSFGPERDIAVPADALGRHFIASIDGEQTTGEILTSAAARWPGLAPGRTRRRWVEFCEAFQAVAALALLRR